MDDEADEVTTVDEVGSADDVVDEDSTIDDELAGVEEEANETTADDVVDDDVGGVLLAAEELSTDEDPETDADEAEEVGRLAEELLTVLGDVLPDTEEAVDVPELVPTDTEVLLDPTTLLVADDM